MINNFLLIFSSIFIYEFILYSNFKTIIISNIKIYKKIIKLFKFKNTSDLRKEKLTFFLAKLLFTSSLKIIFILTLIFIFILILNFISENFLNSLISVFGFIKLIIISIIYHQLRKLINAKLY